MIISGGFIDCVLSAAGQNGAGGNYSDYSHHRWTITGSSGQITTTRQTIDATWQLVSGNGYNTSNMPGYGSSWTRSPGSKPAPLVVYISGSTVVLQRSGVPNSLPNAFTYQEGSSTQHGDVGELGLVGLMGSNPVVPMQTGLEWSSSLQASSFSSPIVIVHLPIFGKRGIRTSISFAWNAGLTDTNME